METLAESLKVRIQCGGNVLHPPNQGERVNRAFFKQFEKIWGSQTLVCTGNFKLPNITCSKGSVAGCKQSRRFLGSVRNDSLMQVLDEPARGVVQLDLLLSTNNSLGM